MILALLCAAAFLAGFVDAVGGGGGLVTLPALLWSGMPPHVALATNKGQSVFGAAMSLWRYWQSGQFRALPWASLLRPFVVAAVFAALGAALALFVDAQALRPILLALLVGAGLMILRMRNTKRTAPSVEASAAGTQSSRQSGWFLDAILPACAGLYDGFFGPGTGTFLLLAYVVVANVDFVQASARAKVVNFATNLAAVSWFGWHGHVAWAIALPMAAAQLVGSYLGVTFALRGGSKVVRQVVIGVMLLLVLRLAFMVA